MHLHAETRLSAPVDAVFPFFADPANLERLTPPWLNFTIRTPQPIEMRRGASIEYRIALHGLPMAWLTEISAYQPPTGFVDEQRRGPYRKWIHTHRFLPSGTGTLVLDDVEFDMVGGRLIAALVKRELRRIFSFRHQALVTHFKESSPLAAPDITFA